MRKFSFPSGHILLILGVVALMGVNATLLYQTQHKVKGEQKVAEEAAKPAEIALTILTAPACAECFNVQDLLSPLKSNAQVKVNSEKTIEYTADEGVALVQKYGITRVPTVIIQGNVDKVFDPASFIGNLGKKADDGALVVTNVPPPYTEVASGAVKGKFTLTYLTDKACKECYDPALHRRALGALGMKPTTERFVDRGEAEGQRLIAQYKIASAPTILLAGDLQEYPRFLQVWPSVGTAEKDNAYVFRSGQALMGAYHDLKTGKVVKPEPPKVEANSQ